MLRFSLLCLSLAVGLSTALPLEELESMPNPNNPDEMMYYVPAEKRSPIGQANQLRDLLHALEMEAAIEEAEENGRPVDEERGVEGVEDGPGLPPAAGLESTHSVDKRRRRRYGFWVTAINKMGKGHLRGFLGQHKNIYNVYKRSQAI